MPGKEMKKMASKRQVKKKTCEKKVPHKTLQSAILVSRKMRDRTGQVLDAYFCRNCGFYHIGHRQQGTRARLKHLRKDQ